jgi:hypothetical protein
MSSTILAVIVLVVMWVVVLVPMLVRRADEPAEADGTAAVEPVGRLPSRRLAPADAADRAADPAVDRSADQAIDPTPGDARRRMMVRRRRTLGILVGLAVVYAAAALVVSSRLWSAQVVMDVLLVGYVGWLRVEARRAAERRRQAFAQSGVTASPARAPAAGRPASTRPAVPPLRSPAARADLAWPVRPPQVVRLDDEDPRFAELGEAVGA